MVPIRNIELTLSKEALDTRNLLSVSNRVQVVFFVHFIGELHLGADCVGTEQFTDATLWIIIQAHNWAEIRNTSSKQLQTIIFWFSHGVLVWKYNSCTPRLQMHASQQAGACKRLAIVSEYLLVKVVAGSRILLQD